MTTRILANKLTAYKALHLLAESGGERLHSALTDTYHPEAEWRGSHPLNELTGIDAMEEIVWGPLFRAFPDLERRDTIFVGGVYGGRDYVAAVGHYCGTFRQDWLSIPATGRPVYLRYGEVHRMEEGRIVQSTVLLDILDLIRQAGFWPLAPSLGTEEQWPCPITADGLVFTEQDPNVSAGSIAQTLAMHGTLGDYNDKEGRGREGLLEMPQKQHWHPKMMWYGPCGIGTTRGLQGFVDYHQLPFRTAFPNRKGGTVISEEDKAGHYIRIGDGKYSVTSGWPSVRADHLGGGWLGVGPTGRHVKMRVMDFYLHHEGLIRENWVPLDIIHVLLQMGVDVFDRMQSFFHRGDLGRFS